MFLAKFFEPTYLGSVITDPIPHYNKYQIWIALFVIILSSAAQYLRFREINWSKNKNKFEKSLPIFNKFDNDEKLITNIHILPVQFEFI